MGRVRDPVLWAAFDLQSRVYNIVVQQFFRVYLTDGSEEQRTYAERNTLFLFAQYLAWVEIVRRSVHFLDLGGTKENREVVDHFSKISSVLNSDGFPDLLFCIFRGDQRAIGEVMIEVTHDGELACICYAEFCARMAADVVFAKWFEGLGADIDHMASARQPHPRLVRLQDCLMDLINFLDPECVRFPDRHRHKL
jgi:hypothetical protein